MNQSNSRENSPTTHFLTLRRRRLKRRRSRNSMSYLSSLLSTTRAREHILRVFAHRLLLQNTTESDSLYSSSFTFSFGSGLLHFRFNIRCGVNRVQRLRARDPHCRSRRNNTLSEQARSRKRQNLRTCCRRRSPSSRQFGFRLFQRSARTRTSTSCLQAAS